jgi:hypothetical protein
MKKLLPFVFALLGVAAATTSIAQTKWHPGHYVILNSGDSQSRHFQNIDEIAREPAVKGVVLRIWWYNLEKSKGSYDFSKIDAYLNKLKSLSTPKRLVIRIMDRKFNTTNKSGIVPNYLLTESVYKGGLTLQKTNNPGYVARLWEAPVMDRLIALYKAIGSRYDGNVYLEGLATEETTLSLGDKSKWPSGYSNDALVKQYLRLIAVRRSNMPRTQLFIGANYLGTDSQMGTVIQKIYEQDAAVAGSNTMPSRITQAQRIWTGQTGGDYSGEIGIASGVESLELGGEHGSYTPKQLYTYANSTLKANYMFWVRNSWAGSAGQKWSTGILPFLRTNPPLRTACPTAYGSCTTK